MISNQMIFDGDKMLSSGELYLRVNDDKSNVSDNRSTNPSSLTLSSKLSESNLSDKGGHDAESVLETPSKSDFQVPRPKKMDRKELLSKISREWRELSSSEKQRFKHEAARKMREWKFDKREEYRAAFAKAIGRRQGGFGVYKNQLTPYNFYLKEKVPQLIQEKKKNGEEFVQKEIFKTVAEQWGLQEDMTKWREQSDKDADRYEEEVEHFNANNISPFQN